MYVLNLGNISQEQIVEDLTKMTNMSEMFRGLGLPGGLSNVPAGDVNGFFDLIQGNTALEDM